MGERIFLSPPHMSGKEQDYIRRAFDENYITSLGSNVTEFETLATEITGTPHALAVINATAALHLALRLSGVGDGDEVYASSFTFIGSINPVLYQHARPVFIDSDLSSWNLDPKLLEADILRRKKLRAPLPKALILTHLYGQMAHIEPISGLCREHGITLIEDAAESLGATYKDRHSGTFGHFGAYSFNGNKILTTSGGGLLVTADDDALKKARFLSTQAKDDAPHYEHTTYGYNYRMSNILAGVGIAQLQVLDARVARKREIFAYYRDALESTGAVSFMPEIPHSVGNRWLTTLTFKDFTTRERIRLALEADNIESRPLWKPMHLQPLFEGAESVVNGVSERLFDTGLCLPSGTAMNQSDLDRVIKIVKENL